MDKDAFSAISFIVLGIILPITILSLIIHGIILSEKEQDDKAVRYYFGGKMEPEND